MAASRRELSGNKFEAHHELRQHEPGLDIVKNSKIATCRMLPNPENMANAEPASSERDMSNAEFEAI